MNSIHDKQIRDIFNIESIINKEVEVKSLNEVD